MILLEVLHFNGDFTKADKLGIFDNEQQARTYIKSLAEDELPMFPEFRFFSVPYKGILS